MALCSGTRLGPYEIHSTAGVGGMGEVYRARDTRLDRTVAIKILSEQKASPDYRKRFELEARAISKLNDPHICTLYDIGHQDGTDYLVMEFLEGETLAQRIQRGPLPIQEVLKTGIEVAGALDKAHRQGIIHRDLKPGNIMLTKSGAKLMDFGLAKAAVAAAATAVTVSAAPTMMSAALTADHALVGTLVYMSPEQIEGKPVDARSDIFAFGSVLYEMVTGKRPFAGKSDLSTASAIMEKAPEPLSAFQPLAPALMQRVVGRCLEKDPDNRYQTARDLAADLKWIAAGTPEIVPPERTQQTGMPWRWISVFAVVLIGLLVPTLWWMWSRQGPTAGPVVRATIPLSSSVNSGSTQSVEFVAGGLAISPDGQTIVFVGKRGQEDPRLFVRRLNDWEPRPIDGTDKASMPFFSPDGKYVGFVAVDGRSLRRISVDGGASQAIATFGQCEGASWTEDGRIVYGQFPQPGLWSVPAEGGNPEQLAKPADESDRYRDPQLLPGGRALLFTTFHRGVTGAAILDLSSGKVIELLDSAANAQYVSTGHLVYATQEQLRAVPFDLAKLKITGKPVVVLPDFRESGFAISTTGTLVYLNSSSTITNLVWRDRRGNATPLNLRPRGYWDVRLSPDGQRLAVGVSEGAKMRLYVGRVSGEPLQRLSFGDDDYFPLFSPDGQHMAFLSSGKDNRYNIYMTSPDGSEKPVRLTETSDIQKPVSWHPAGNVILLNQGKAKDDPVLHVYELTMSRGSAPITKPLFADDKFTEYEPAFSPDGKWVAYLSNETGRWEVYVRPYGGKGMKSQVSVDGSVGALFGSPRWNPKGNELFFGGPAGLMSVRLQNGVPLGSPTRLFPQSPLNGWDVGRDGQHFLLIEPVEFKSASVNVIFNWFQELKSKSSTRN